MHEIIEEVSENSSTSKDNEDYLGTSGDNDDFIQYTKSVKLQRSSFSNMRTPPADMRNEADELLLGSPQSSDDQELKIQ